MTSDRSSEISFKEKAIATASAIAKGLILFYVGRLFANVLTEKFPSHAEVAEKLVLVSLVFPLVFWVLRPYFALVLPRAKSDDSAGTHEP